MSKTQAQYWKYCCSKKAISVTYSESVFVALGTQREMGMRHDAIRVIFGSTVFFQIIS